MTNLIENKVRERLCSLGHGSVSSSIHIRLISSMDRCFHVGNPIQENFKLNTIHSQNNDSSSSSSTTTNSLPETIGYKCKSFAMFQQQDGSDICLFCMYVQEYNDDAPLPNRRNVYISYLDSVEYFRPRTNDSSLRTNVYHEIIISYIAWVRLRGFLKVHLWSCPPQRGNNFIFWCHPQHQRTPNKERLILWYQNMCHVARERGVVTHITDFYDEYFKPILGEMSSSSSSSLSSLTSSSSSSNNEKEVKKEKKLTKKGKRMLNMAKVGRNGRGRGRNGWKSRSTWGLDNNFIHSTNINDIKLLGPSAIVGGIIEEETNDNEDDDDDDSNDEKKKNENKRGEDNIDSDEDKKKQEKHKKSKNNNKQVKIESFDELEKLKNESLEKDMMKYDNIFKPLNDNNKDIIVTCPPLFEGDYWIDEVNRLFYLKHRKKINLSNNCNNLNPITIANAFIKSLRQHHLSHAFNQPVDPIALNIPDYFDVIEQPMDFSTISNKLKNNEYPLMRDMLEDIDLTLNNAQIYNPIKHPVHTAAANLKTFKNREWKLLCNRWDEKYNNLNSSKNYCELSMVSLIEGVSNIVSSSTLPSRRNLSEPLQQLGQCENISISTMSDENDDSLSINENEKNQSRKLRSSGGISSTTHEEALAYDHGTTRRKKPPIMDILNKDDDVKDEAPVKESLAHVPFVRSLSSTSMASEVSSFDNSVMSDGSSNIGRDGEFDDDDEDDHHEDSTNVHGDDEDGGVSGVKNMMNSLRQHHHWLMRDVGKSVFKLRGDLLVLHLSPNAAPNLLSRNLSLKAWQLYIGKDYNLVHRLLTNQRQQTENNDDHRSSDSSSSHNALGSSGSGGSEIMRSIGDDDDGLLNFNENEPDPFHVSRPLMDGRHTMLEVSMFKHLQFDTLRRAKHSTAMLLYHLHFPSQSFHVKCSLCNCILDGLRWHCSSCTDYDICGECNTKQNLMCNLQHPLTPYHVSTFE
jgi:hypothetical protein